LRRGPALPRGGSRAGRGAGRNGRTPQFSVFRAESAPPAKGPHGRACRAAAPRTARAGIARSAARDFACGRDLCGAGL